MLDDAVVRSDTGASAPTIQSSRPKRWRRRLTVLLLGLGIVTFLAAILLTDGAPRVGPRAAPTAEQVGAGRNAIDQVRLGEKSVAGTSLVWLGSAHLDGLGAMASQGYRPARLAMRIDKGVFRTTGSLPLAWGRWLNVDLDATTSRHGFPETRIRIGSLALSPAMSRRVLDAGLGVLRWRGVILPPLDRMVRNFAVKDGAIVATVHVSIDSLFDRKVDPVMVAAIFCRLNAEQKADPQGDFAVQVRRAFSAGRNATASSETNRAAFVALAMFTVDRQVGDAARVRHRQTAKCVTASPIPITLQGRADLPKHWSLSAALAALSGVQLAEAMGEWKELTDSLSRASEFQPGDPTGFSFVDIAADRSGFHVARAAISSEHASAIAARLSGATQAQILPPMLLGREDGLPEGEFRKRYGGIDDPRYLARVREIDEILARGSLAGS